MVRKPSTIGMRTILRVGNSAATTPATLSAPVAAAGTYCFAVSAMGCTYLVAAAETSAAIWATKACGVRPARSMSWISSARDGGARGDARLVRTVAGVLGEAIVETDRLAGVVERERPPAGEGERPERGGHVARHLDHVALLWRQPQRADAGHLEFCGHRQ